MIEAAMYFSMGFFLASLGALVVVPLVYSRAVRLTTRRLEATIPSSMAEILADKDLLRAEFAMSTRRLETSLEQLKAKSASQLVELGRKSDSVNLLRIELNALRDKVGPTEEEFALKADAVRTAEHALSDKELQLTNLMEKLNERSTLANAQKIEIIALKTQVEMLKVKLDGASNELKAGEERRPHLERVLSDKESQLAKLMDELNERSTLAQAQKIEINELKSEIETLKERLREASNGLKTADERRRDLESALSEKVSQLAKLMDELNERSTLPDDQKIEINALKTQVEALKEQLDTELKAAEHHADVERNLSDKESELATLMAELNERYTLAEAHKIEIIALKTEIEALKGRLYDANNQLKTVEAQRNSEHIELKTASQKLIEERGKFENFHHRVAEIAQQLVAQSTQDKILRPRVEELEKSLLEQSQLVNEREIELTHLRGEFEIARKAEADLRVALIEVDSRENMAMQKLETENAKLKAAVDRANGDRVRLTYELANKNRQAEGRPATSGLRGHNGWHMVDCREELI